MLIGELLSREERFAAYGPQAVVDAWMGFVVPKALSRHRVQVVGLKGRPELNGHYGKIGEFYEAKGRYPVRFDGERTSVRELLRTWLGFIWVSSCPSLPHRSRRFFRNKTPDACFVLKQSGAFGVFDGVGGWAEEGVDPAEYSEKFAEKSAQSVLAGQRDPVAVMRDAHEATQVIGSCTACIAVLKNGNVLDIANLGDAGALVSRDGGVVFHTKSQQHEFNLPYQLGWTKVYPEGDRPDAADRVEVEMKPGDAVVLGSDGLWDNVPYAEVAALCAEHQGDAEECAEAIATLAFGYSCDPEYDSPFTQEARKAAEGRPEWADRRNLIGGKMDDIAVVCMFVEASRGLSGGT